MALQRRVLCRRRRYWTGPVGHSECDDFGVECTFMARIDLACWIAHSTSNVTCTWISWSSLRWWSTSKVMGWHFSKITPVPSQSTSHKTSLTQMQFVDFRRQHTHRPVPHRALARDLRDAPPQTVVQLYLVIQEIWDDTLQARIIHLIPFVPRRCRVVHEAHVMSLSLLTSVVQQDIAKCHNKLSLSNSFTTDLLIQPMSNNFTVQFSHLSNFPLKLKCVPFLLLILFHCHTSTPPFVIKPKP